MPTCGRGAIRSSPTADSLRRCVDEVVHRSDNTEFGLGASIWSSYKTRAREIAGRVTAGAVWITKHADLVPHIPFGGAKQSGAGVEFGREGLLEYTQIKVISACDSQRKLSKKAGSGAVEHSVDTEMRHRCCAFYGAFTTASVDKNCATEGLVRKEYVNTCAKHSSLR
jgi:delta 1-pyrroline-5-carboxylate dehydrogenase